METQKHEFTRSEIELSRAILNEIKSATDANGNPENWFDGDIPEDDQECGELGLYFAEKSQEAYDQDGMRHPTILAVLALVESYEGESEYRASEDKGGSEEDDGSSDGADEEPLGSGEQEPPAEPASFAVVDNRSSNVLGEYDTLVAAEDLRIRLIEADPSVEGDLVVFEVGENLKSEKTEEERPTEEKPKRKRRTKAEMEAARAAEAAVKEEESSKEITPEQYEEELREIKARPEEQFEATTDMHPVELAAFRERLPIPLAVDEQPPAMPRDLTELNDVELRQIHSIYNSFLARSKWLLALASSDKSNAERLKDEAYRVAFIKTDKTDSDGKRKLSELIEAEAKGDDEYRSWSEKVAKHAQDVNTWKTLVEIYAGNVDRCSREWTMRTDESNRVQR